MHAAGRAGSRPRRVELGPGETRAWRAAGQQLLPLLWGETSPGGQGREDTWVGRGPCERRVAGLRGVDPVCPLPVRPALLAPAPPAVHRAAPVAVAATLQGPCGGLGGVTGRDPSAPEPARDRPPRVPVPSAQTPEHRDLPALEPSLLRPQRLRFF